MKKPQAMSTFTFFAILTNFNNENIISLPLPCPYRSELSLKLIYCCPKMFSVLGTIGWQIIDKSFG